MFKETNTILLKDNHIIYASHFGFNEFLNAIFSFGRNLYLSLNDRDFAETILKF